MAAIVRRSAGSVAGPVPDGIVLDRGVVELLVVYVDILSDRR